MATVPPRVAPFLITSMSPEPGVGGVVIASETASARFAPASTPQFPGARYTRISPAAYGPPAYTGENAPRVSTKRHGVIETNVVSVKAALASPFDDPVANELVMPVGRSRT